MESSRKAHPSSRVDPEEEYFRLTCLALKIEHSERDQDDIVFTITESKLFRMAKKRNLPFHTWHNWVDDQFHRVKNLKNRAVEKHADVKPAKPQPKNDSPAGGIISWI